MKFEHFEVAKNLVCRITETNKLINDLSSKNLIVKVTENTFTILTIGADPSFEHSCSLLAAKFVGELLSYYKQKRNGMLLELETL